MLSKRISLQRKDCCQRTHIPNLDPIIHLETCQPLYPTPAFIINSAITSHMDNQTKYSAPAGLDTLRAEIAQFVPKRRGEISIERENVVVGPGAKSGLFWALLGTVEPGEGVIIPDSGFPSH